MRKSRKLWVESLENRALLAGNVSVSVDGDVLHIDGDGNGNGVSVQQIDTNKYFVTGFALNGSNTTINGQSTGRVVSGIRHFDVDLNAGSDIFIMSNSAFRRDQLAQQLSGGTAGPIQASPQASNTNTTHPVTTRVVGDVTIDLDDGNDGVGLGARIGHNDSNGNIVDGVLAINGGNGRDQVNVDRSTAFDDMLFNMGSGNDTVHADVVRVGDFIFASMGDGIDRFTSNNAHGWHSQILGGNHNDVVDIRNYRMEQEVFVDTGSGNDRIYGAGVGGISIAFVTGDGDDSVGVDGANSRGGSTVDTGSGNDFVRLNGFFTEDHLGVFQGDGDDTLRLKDTTADDTTLSGGSGFDRFFNDGGNNLGGLSKSGYEQG
jgi:hypothetical protein